jgi:hypothetical protein
MMRERVDRSPTHHFGSQKVIASSSYVMMRVLGPIFLTDSIDSFVDECGTADAGQ